MTGSTRALAPPAPTLLRDIVESRGFTLADTIVIAVNALVFYIVNSMQSMQSEMNENVRARALAAHDEREALARQVEAPMAEIRQIRDALRKD